MLYCLRLDDATLKYKYLNEFDRAMNGTEEQYKWLCMNPGYVTTTHETDKIIAFERNLLVFVFNFHHEKSYTDYWIGVEFPGTYKVVLSTDDEKFGGFNRVDTSLLHFSSNESHAGRQHIIKAYLPSRAAFVFARVDNK